MEVKEIERSIIKKYRKEIWSKFVRAINEFSLIQDGDAIMVCISGGKDSFLMAKCFEEIQKHGHMSFTCRYVVMDPGYSEENKNKIEENAKKLSVPIEFFSSDIFEVVSTVESKSPCYLCARMRRGHLYNYAKEIGCNKIALGHHFDDVVETVLLSMFYASEFQTMMPKLYSDHFPGLELIRPMYFIREEDIKRWAKTNELTFLNCACKFTEKNLDGDGKRAEMKKVLAYLRSLNPDIDYNIYKSTTNVNLNCVLGYHKDGIKYDFLEDYGKKE
ncbi:TPA: tRNA 2-thiocytidine biosynthesis protein TtcA [Candidatus Ventrenecus avicola]|nr:tRNA 2-thiocytidine biosynthesis protein TtcA [Candidatus Ventrenecus avicola]